jgi:hypothetical protein
MNSLAIPLAVLCALVLASVGLSLTVLYYATSFSRAAARQAQALRDELESELQGLRTGLDSVAAEVHDIELPPSLQVLPGIPRSGLNMGKRTQALRMHRRGESSTQIAATLEVPVQEVELLLKVHRIVISKI